MAGCKVSGCIVTYNNMRTIDKTRLRERMGRVDAPMMDRVDNAIAVSFGLAQ